MSTASDLTTPAHGFTVATIEGAYYVTVKDASTLLDVSLRLVYNLADRRDPPLQSREFGGLRLIELDSLKAEAARRGIVIPELGEASR